MIKRFHLPQVISDGRLDLILKIVNQARLSAAGRDRIILNWGKVREITPAGHAILAVLLDLFFEQKNDVENEEVAPSLRLFPAIENLCGIDPISGIRPPSAFALDLPDLLVRVVSIGIDALFCERMQEKFGSLLSDDQLYACRLIINELMQNSADHSGAERIYLYAGRYETEFHFGVLDMGVGIPTRLGQKYVKTDDLKYLELAFQRGSTTRRERPGGLGLNYFMEYLRDLSGKLTIVSRGAQVRRYFNTRKSQKNLLKYSLPGTWCFDRLELKL